jgi:hypothetical protein
MFPLTLAPPVSLKRNVEVLIVAGFIALLKVALTTASLAVSGQRPLGFLTITVGAHEAEVVKFHDFASANGSPVVSAAAVLMVAV